MILSIDSYSVRTNALLDCGADSTLVREYIAKILQLNLTRRTEAAKDTECIFRFKSDRPEVSKFYNFLRPSPAENANHQTMVNTKLVDPTH